MMVDMSLYTQMIQPLGDHVSLLHGCKKVAIVGRYPDVIHSSIYGTTAVDEFTLYQIEDEHALLPEMAYDAIIAPFLQISMLPIITSRLKDQGILIALFYGNRSFDADSLSSFSVDAVTLQGLLYANGMVESVVMVNQITLQYSNTARFEEDLNALGLDQCDIQIPKNDIFTLPLEIITVTAFKTIRNKISWRDSK